MPPPNANGSLHLGHATFVTIEDIMIRYKRMRGYRALLLPGTDHAGIQTQAVFERDILIKERNQTKFDLGREKFYEECYNFCINSKSTIENQFRILGASCDWSRKKFTLDPEISKQVLKTFKDLYRDGLVFKGKYLVNWCPRCGTTLSNIETDHKDENDKIWEIKYKIKNSEKNVMMNMSNHKPQDGILRQAQDDNSKRQAQDDNNQNENFVIVATTRPETMLGDTAVAVNPRDERYKNLAGKTLILPLMNREIPIIFDESVDMKFGTGCVKVTPAHDPVDYEIGKRHNLEMIEVIDKFDKITENGGVYAGMEKLEARKKILEDLKNLNLLGEEKPHKHEVRICERCKTKIESLLSDEWYVNIKPMAKKAIEGIENGEVKILPERSKKVLIDWLKEFQPWPISRQIWWGHRVPVWYKKEKLQNSKNENQNEISIKNMKMKDDEDFLVSTTGKIETDLVVVRHGEAEHNVLKIKNGDPKIDYHLTEIGKKQAENLQEFFEGKHFDAIFVSEHIRTRETAEIALKKTKYEKLIVDELLNDKKNGELEGFSENEYYKISENERLKIGGESIENIQKRVKLFIEKIRKNYKGKRVLIFTHSAILRNLNILLEHYDPLNNENSSGKLPKATPYFYTLFDEPTEELVQDEDTFDTWFSSGQWPVTTLGGPNPSEDFLNFYPTDMMETGWDIIFFWVARMLMLGKYMTGKFPFKNVYLHGLARDKNGTKMSKSKGNGIDPLITIEKYGTDALRLALSIGSSAGEDFRIYEEKIEGMRNFVNKLWNAGRFLEINFNNLEVSNNKSQNKIENIWNVWILKKSLEVVSEVTEDFENHRYGIAGEKIKNFTWNVFCDWYLEAMKIFVKENFNETKFVASKVFETILKLLHPFAPFVTEQLWGDLKISDKMLIESEWIDLKNFGWVKNLIGDEDVEILKKVVEETRSIFVDILERDDEAKSFLFSENKNEKILLEKNLEILKNLTGIKNLEISDSKTFSLKTPITNTISAEFEISGEKKEKAKIRVEKEIQALEKYITGIDEKLSNKGFVANAPKEILENTKKIFEKSKQKIAKLKIIKF